MSNDSIIALGAAESAAASASSAATSAEYAAESAAAFDGLGTVAEQLADRIDGVTDHGNVSGAVSIDSDVSTHWLDATGATELTITDGPTGGTRYVSILPLSGAADITLTEPAAAELADGAFSTFAWVRGAWMLAGSGAAADPFTVSATAPTVKQDLAGTSLDAYTIPSKTGVVYKVGGVVKAAGDHFTGGGTSVTVTAEPDPGYTLTGTATWTLTFSTDTETVTPTAPTFSEVDDTYTIPADDGVVYKVGGITKAAGTYAATPPVTITVTAEALNADYTLTGTTTWTYSFAVFVSALRDATLSLTPDLYVPGTKTGTTVDQLGTVNGVSISIPDIFVTATLGDGPQVMRFADTNGFLATATQPSATTFSVGILFKPSTLVPGGRILFTTNAYNHWGITLGNDGQINFYVGTTSANAPAATSVGAETFAVLTYDGTNIRSYVNGTLRTTTPKAGFVFDSGFSFQIGDGGSGMTVPGDYSTLIYGRNSVWTAEQIADLWTAAQAA